ncbi:MAG: acetyl-CoA carboxylase carboxyltransferase subunit alpha [Phycisphaerales bacterium]
MATQSPVTTYKLPFELSIIELEKQMARLRSESDSQDASAAEKLKALEANRDSLLTNLYRDLRPWDTVLVARHPHRPQTSDYIERMCRDFAELHGDRRFGDDPAMITGFARIGSEKVMLIGHQKGKTTSERMACHFGCAHPEGYRKALHKMKLAEKFGLPIVTLIDTQGAYPGIGSEQRGIAEAIAVNLREMARLKTIIISVVIGEGGSGGALGIGVADRVAMLEHAWYSVISPEGCAAILWKESTEATRVSAARALALTARENLKNGIIDAVIEEPLGGAHRGPQEAADRLAAWIGEQIRSLKRFKPQTLVRRRMQRFRAFGEFLEPEPDNVQASADDE